MKVIIKLLSYLVILVSAINGVSIMSRGHEDWFISTGAFGKATQDIGELAARFGVPYSFTRSGKVIYSDGFEASLSPWVIASGAGFGTAVIDTTQSYRGCNSLKMKPAAAGAQQARAQKFIPYVIGGKIGIEVLAAGTSDADYAWIRLGVRRNGVFSYYVFHLHFPSSKLYYLDSSGNKALALDIGGDIGGDDLQFHLMKMVIDPVEIEYDYIQLNNTRVSLSGILPWSSVNPAPDLILAALFVEDTDGDEGVVHFDDLSITVDEP